MYILWHVNAIHFVSQKVFNVSLSCNIINIYIFAFTSIHPSTLFLVTVIILLINLFYSNHVHIYTRNVYNLQMQDFSSKQIILLHYCIATFTLNEITKYTLSTTVELSKMSLAVVFMQMSDSHCAGYVQSNRIVCDSSLHLAGLWSVQKVDLVFVNYTSRA